MLTTLLSPRSTPTSSRSSPKQMPSLVSSAPSSDPRWCTVSIKLVYSSPLESCPWWFDKPTKVTSPSFPISASKILLASFRALPLSQCGELSSKEKGPAGPIFLTFETIIRSKKSLKNALNDFVDNSSLNSSLAVLHGVLDDRNILYRVIINCCAYPAKLV